MKIIVLDSESDGLWKEATKLHVVAWTDDGETYHHTNDYEVMKSLLLEEDTRIVAHNSIRHDLPTPQQNPRAEPEPHKVHRQSGLVLVSQL